MKAEPIVWTCSHGQGYTAFELECGMTMLHMEWLMEQERAEHELAADLDHEEWLGHEHVQGSGDCPWPWYADAPYEVIEPEIVELPCI